MSGRRGLKYLRLDHQASDRRRGPFVTLHGVPCRWDPGVTKAVNSAVAATNIQIAKVWCECHIGRLGGEGVCTGSIGHLWDDLWCERDTRYIPCHPVPSHATPCRPILHRATPSHPIPCHPVLPCPTPHRPTPTPPHPIPSPPQRLPA